MYDPLKRERLYKLIVDEITRSILTGEQKPGDQLPTEPAMAEQFRVSRTVVREAMKALTLQGLVEISPGRGTFITVPPIEIVTNGLHMLLELEDHSFDELIVARQILEVPIARLAAENAAAENLLMLDNLLGKMRHSIHDSAEFIRFDTLFHAELAMSTQNLILNVLIRPILTMMSAHRQAVVRVPDMADRALDHHRLIFQAVARHDGNAAEKGMREHLQQIAEDIGRARQTIVSGSTNGIDTTHTVEQGVAHERSND